MFSVVGYVDPAVTLGHSGVGIPLDTSWSKNFESELPLNGYN